MTYQATTGALTPTFKQLNVARKARHFTLSAAKMILGVAYWESLIRITIKSWRGLE
jgi:hypothetical protein